jgi:protease-4
MTNKDFSVHAPDAQALLNQIVIEHLHEKKRKRFWRWVWRMVGAFVILLVMYQFFSIRMEDASFRAKPHVGLIEVNGGIFDNQATDADHFVKGLEKAYTSQSMKALILRIDSPGGSPVQADDMYNAIRYYRNKYPDIRVYAVCVDMCASAAYYVASAADEIYANPSSLVGSIGVLYNGFGFVDTLQKLGVTRRLYTAGRQKGFLDQFSPVDPAQEKKLKTILDVVHQQFINKVREGRGKRLLIDGDTFSGLFWTGLQAKERGLIDGFASAGQLARDTIKIERIVVYTYETSAIELFAKNMGTSVANELPRALGMRTGLEL